MWVSLNRKWIDRSNNASIPESLWDLDRRSLPLLKIMPLHWAGIPHFSITNASKSNTSQAPSPLPTSFLPWKLDRLTRSRKAIFRRSLSFYPLNTTITTTTRYFVRAIQDHIPWLLANVGPTLNPGRHETIAMIVRCTKTIIRQFKPQESGTLALFILVANLARRLEFVKEHGPWCDLYDAVRSKDYGWISEWNPLKLVSFAWFLASGPTVGLRDVLDDDVRSQDIILLVVVLRNAQIVISIRFL